MSSLEYWKNEFKKITDTDVVTNTDKVLGNENNNLNDNSASLREVKIIVTNKIIGKYEARSYPHDDYNDNGKIELYEVDVYEILIIGKDDAGNPVKNIWSAPRFMPYWNNPQNPYKEYKTKGWVNSGLSKARFIIVSKYISNYQVRNRYSPGRGAIVLLGSFYIHAGPADLDNVGFGSAGCIEIIGNFDDFKADIQALSGSEETSPDNAIIELVKNKKLKVKIEEANVPNIRNRFTREL